jgi:hypothetical protein
VKRGANTALPQTRRCREAGTAGKEHAMKECLQALDVDLLAAGNAVIGMLFGLLARIR